ncbi:hypothetical protein QF023_001773 [Chryseobacterium sp. SLBN-27]|uniref:hypothetical protein n=1 Tax=Chryseobacterium sp. SLBN-27 TaxID=3042287 RepID=UPI00285FD0BC|nr:hypothetical protein [Chryseobacterium sp. SLBN-27]MDR6158257.1 hypothetical protein [Chryseobacterium sp. SLBN-27]
MKSQNYLEKLEMEQLSELANFVVNENMSHHTDTEEAPEHIQEMITKIYYEDLNLFFNSEFFVSKDSSGEIEGVIRIVKWDYNQELPIQTLFQINPLQISSRRRIPIWHIGRFATRKNIGDRFLFKRLMVCAIAPLCRKKRGLAFAECDSKLLRAMKLLGIKAKVLGKSINYLGSETIPISLDYEGLKDFYHQNKKLIRRKKLTPVA